MECSWKVSVSSEKTKLHTCTKSCIRITYEIQKLTTMSNWPVLQTSKLRVWQFVSNLTKKKDRIVLLLYACIGLNIFCSIYKLD